MGMRTLDITTTCMVGLLLASFTVLFATRASKMTPTDFPSDAGTTVHLEDVEFLTGDMIFYQCCPYINFVVNSVWSHVAIVYVVDGVPFVAEVASQSGFTLKPLHDVVLKALWDGTTRVAVRQACGRRRIDPERLRALDDAQVPVVKQIIRAEGDHGPGHQLVSRRPRQIVRVLVGRRGERFTAGCGFSPLEPVSEVSDTGPAFGRAGAIR